MALQKYSNNSSQSCFISYTIKNKQTVTNHKAQSPSNQCKGMFLCSLAEDISEVNYNRFEITVENEPSRAVINKPGLTRPFDLVYKSEPQSSSALYTLPMPDGMDACGPSSRMCPYNDLQGEEKMGTDQSVQSVRLSSNFGDDSPPFFPKAYICFLFITY